MLPWTTDWAECVLCCASGVQVDECAALPGGLSSAVKEAFEQDIIGVCETSHAVNIDSSSVRLLQCKINHSFLQPLFYQLVSCLYLFELSLNSVFLLKFVVTPTTILKEYFGI